MFYKKNIWYTPPTPTMHNSTLIYRYYYLCNSSLTVLHSTSIRVRLASFTWNSDTIIALVTCFAVPFAPVGTCFALPTVWGMHGRFQISSYTEERITTTKWKEVRFQANINPINGKAGANKCCIICGGSKILLTFFGILPIFAATNLPDYHWDRPLQQFPSSVVKFAFFHCSTDHKLEARVWHFVRQHFFWNEIKTVTLQHFLYIIGATSVGVRIRCRVVSILHWSHSTLPVLIATIITFAER